MGNARVNPALVQQNTQRNTQAEIDAALAKQAAEFQAKEQATALANSTNKGASTSTAVGNLSERGAADLFDRYSSPAALAAYRNSRSPDVQSIISSAMDQSRGINANENAAMRQNMFSNINAQQQANTRQLRGGLAANGVRGAMAVGMMQQGQAQGVQAIGDQSRKLVADNIAFKRDGLANAANIVGTQENIERDQAADKLGTVLAGRAENAGLQAAQWQAQAAAASGQGGGGKK